MFGTLPGVPKSDLNRTMQGLANTALQNDGLVREYRAFAEYQHVRMVHRGHHRNSSSGRLFRDVFVLRTEGPVLVEPEPEPVDEEAAVYDAIGDAWPRGSSPDELAIRAGFRTDTGPSSIQRRPGPVAPPGVTPRPRHPRIARPTRRPHSKVHVPLPDNEAFTRAVTRALLNQGPMTYRQIYAALKDEGVIPEAHHTDYPHKLLPRKLRRATVTGQLVTWRKAQRLYVSMPTDAPQEAVIAWRHTVRTKYASQYGSHTAFAEAVVQVLEAHGPMPYTDLYEALKRTGVLPKDHSVQSPFHLLRRKLQPAFAAGMLVVQGQGPATRVAIGVIPGIGGIGGQDAA